MDVNERFTKVWTQAQPIVRGYIHSMVMDFHETDDLLQDVAITLLRKFSEYDESRPFLAWALGVARFKVLSYRNAQSSKPVLLSDFAEKIAAVHQEMAPVFEQRTNALNECLREIKGQSRQIMLQRYGESLKPHEIARRLGLEPNAIRVALARIRESLRKCMTRRMSAERHPA